MANIRQGWRGLPQTNTLAYYELSYKTDIKSVITLGPGGVNVVQDVSSFPYVAFTQAIMKYIMSQLLRFNAPLILCSLDGAF
jgi:hypothetical protein